MRIVVCIKQVFDPATIRVSSRGDLVTREGVRIINPADLCALEEALKLKDAEGAEVVTLTLGGPEAEDALREALAMGADRAVLLSDPAFAGGDAHAVSYALAQAVRAIGDADLVLTGADSLDDGGGQVGLLMAAELGLTQITGGLALAVSAGRASAIQRFETGDRRLSVPLPAVVTIPENSNVPRLALAASIMNVYSQASVQTWSAADIGADAARLGSEGSLTTVRRAFPPEPQPAGEILSGSAAEAAQALAARLRARGLI
jgi:electron transfer flavoprotein beta subunit